ncbi:MAG: hypothetical protein RSE10_09100, partial [Oscillospiraceae bacterium]
MRHRTARCVISPRAEQSPAPTGRTQNNRLVYGSRSSGEQQACAIGTARCVISPRAEQSPAPTG